MSRSCKMLHCSVFCCTSSLQPAFDGVSGSCTTVNFKLGTNSTYDNLCMQAELTTAQMSMLEQVGPETVVVQASGVLSKPI